MLVSQPLRKSDIDLTVLPLDLHLTLRNVFIAVAESPVHIESLTTDILVSVDSGAHQNTLFKNEGDHLGTFFFLLLPSLFPLALFSRNLLNPGAILFLVLFECLIGIQKSALSTSSQSSILTDVVTDDERNIQPVCDQISTIASSFKDSDAVFEGVRESHLCVHMFYCFMYIFTRTTGQI